MKLSMPRFDSAPVLVVGDVMLDRYWHGPTNRISPEAPVPVVRVTELEDRPGGAAGDRVILEPGLGRSRRMPPPAGRPEHDVQVDRLRQHDRADSIVEIQMIPAHERGNRL